MKAADPFRTTDKLDPATLDVIGARLEARGKHPLFARMLQEYLDVMRIDAAPKVLDLGCGTGLAARSVARRPGFGGRVTGIDLSSRLIETATRLAAAEGLAQRVAFRAGDTRSLDVPDASVDAVIAHTLLSHVEDPLAAVREMARVVRPGGMVAIFDGDYASLTFGHADEARGKANDQALISALVTSPRVMRQMPRYLRAAGLQLVASFSHVLAEIGRADFWLPAIEAYSRLIPRAGVMSEAEADDWAQSLLKDAADGVFFGASNYYSYIALRK